MGSVRNSQDFSSRARVVFCFWLLTRVIVIAGDFQDKKGPVAGTLVGNKYAFYVAST